MLCEKCRKNIPDDSLFCPECGAETSQKKAEDMKKALGNVIESPKTVMKTKGSIFYNFGLVVGTGCILAGLIFFFTGCPIESTSFGGDFYTYTYKGIVAIAELMTTLIKAVALLLIAMGTFLDCYILNLKNTKL